MDAYDVLNWPLRKIWEYQAFFLADNEEFKETVKQNSGKSKDAQVAAVQRMLNNMVAK